MAVSDGLDKLGEHEWPVLLASDLKHKPKRIGLHDQALVVFRGEGDVPQVLRDVCPHRGAPLSDGVCVKGRLRCAYHGWLFDGEGQCHEMPGLELKNPTTPIVQALYAREHHGVIWISKTPVRANNELAAWQFERNAPLASHVQASLQLAIENFLDPFHTHFVHSGWVRKIDATQRQRIKVSVSPIQRPDATVHGIEATYFDSHQNGLLSKLFEPNRTHSMGSFLLPAIAEVAYYDHDVCTFAASAWLVPETDGRLRIFAWVGAQSFFVPAWLQKWVMQRLFEKILRQDIAIVETCSVNRQVHPDFSPMSTRLDLLSASIEALLAGRSVSAFATEVSI